MKNTHFFLLALMGFTPVLCHSQSTTTDNEKLVSEWETKCENLNRNELNSIFRSTSRTESDINEFKTRLKTLPIDSTVEKWERSYGISKSNIEDTGLPGMSESDKCSFRLLVKYSTFNTSNNTRNNSPSAPSTSDWTSKAADAENRMRQALKTRDFSSALAARDEMLQYQAKAKSGGKSSAVEKKSYRNASRCLSLDGDNYVKNSCNVPVNFSFCYQNPAREDWGASFNCANGTNGVGSDSVGPNSRVTISSSRSATSISFAGCESPGLAIVDEADALRGLKFHCW